MGALTAPGMFIIEFPFYDVGFVPFTNDISCKIGSAKVNCIKYDLADYITIPMASNYVSGTKITLENLRYPRYQQSGL